jgi:hypothetical protein
MELASHHPSGAYISEVAARFTENSCDVDYMHSGGARFELKSGGKIL